MFVGNIYRRNNFYSYVKQEYIIILLKATTNAQTK
jgi:hypothetical protein